MQFLLIFIGQRRQASGEGEKRIRRAKRGDEREKKNSAGEASALAEFSLAASGVPAIGSQPFA